MELAVYVTTMEKNNFLPSKFSQNFCLNILQREAVPIPTYHSPTALLFLLSWPKINFFTRTTVQDALE